MWRVMRFVRRTTSARRRPGYETGVQRIQGFVAGGLLVAAVDVARQFVCYPDSGKERAIAWVTAILAALAFAWVVTRVDRHEKEPWHMLLVGFLWGTVASPMLARLLNRGAYILLAVPSVAAAPFTEELSKGLFLLLIAACASDEFDDVLDGIVYGAMVGLGFAMCENAGYFYRTHSSDIAELVRSQQFFLRIVLGGLASHATYTAVTGLGLGLGRRAQQRGLKVAFPLLGLGMAIMAHAVWNGDVVDSWLCLNSIPPIIGPWRWRYTVRAVLLTGPCFGVVIGAMICSWRKEDRVIAERLARELSPDDPYVAPAMMCTAKGRFRARWLALRTRGLGAWWTLRRLQRALIALAFCEKQAGDGGGESNGIRRRIRLLRGQLARMEAD
jgi:RsiW-degrading membrane proteinase PrsW (M82 family)